MLAGLAALAIPPIIHLLNRRRYDVVNWGAMQFLQISQVTRRRFFLEELALMLLRMGLIAVLVFALAGPFLSGPAVARLAARARRDVVLVFDGSYSMGSLGALKTPHEAAKDWALALIDDLAPSDTVAVFQAKDVVVPVLPEATRDLERARQAVRQLPPPSGGCDWRQAIKAAHASLASSENSERDIVLLVDGQKHRWADTDMLFRWELLSNELGYNKPEAAGDRRRPGLWVVNVAPDRKPDPPNWGLAPLTSNRPVVPVQRAVTFESAMELRGHTAYAPPHRVRLEVDGKWVRDLAMPRSAQIQSGKVPFSFSHRFGTPGSHLISVVLEPDPPPEERPPGYEPRDALPGDNRQDFSVEVVQALPVLLVDGDSTHNPRRRSTDSLSAALAQKRDRTPVVQVHVVPFSEFDPTMLAPPPARPADGNSMARPRVLILCDVPRLSPPQIEAVSQFLNDGGGVLVALGPRVEPESYNSMLHRNGAGWLPARLDGQESDESTPEQGARPAPGLSDHAALQLFVDRPTAGQGPVSFPQLGQARFPRWWKLSKPGTNPASAVIALLRSASAEYPFLVERVSQDSPGRLLQCSVPLDVSWGTNLPRLPAFVALAHELVYYLAGARSGEFNIEPGQPLRYRLDPTASLEGFSLQTPLSEPKPLSTDLADRAALPAQIDRQHQSAILRHDATREPGVYRLKTPAGAVWYYVVRQRQAEESDLSPATTEDREKVARIMQGMKYQNDRTLLASQWVSESQRQEVWWLLLLGLVGLLCTEVWMTRRIVMNRQ
jgi:hypothetical protein